MLTSNAPWIRATTRRFRRMLPLLAVALAAAFWTAEFAQRAAVTEYRALFKQKRPPYLLTGLHLDFGPEVRFSDHRSALARGPAAVRRIVFVTSDDCQYCVQAQRDWCAVLEETVFPDSDDIVFATHHGRKVPEALAACIRRSGTRAHVAFAIVSHATAFGVRTGLLATPSVVLTTADGVLVRGFAGAEVDVLKRALRTVVSTGPSTAPEPTPEGEERQGVGGNGTHESRQGGV